MVWVFFHLVIISRAFDTPTPLCTEAFMGDIGPWNELLATRWTVACISDQCVMRRETLSLWCSLRLIIVMVRHKLFSSGSPSFTSTSSTNTLSRRTAVCNNMVIIKLVVLLCHLFDSISRLMAQSISLSVLLVQEEYFFYWGNHGLLFFSSFLSVYSKSGLELVTFFRVYFSGNYLMASWLFCIIAWKIICLQ